MSRSPSEINASSRMLTSIFSLYFQCDTNGHGKPCHALADVYFAAVKAFGGQDATKREEDKDWVAEYHRLVEVYHQSVKDAQDAGELPILDKQ